MYHLYFCFIKETTSNEAQDSSVNFLKNVGESVAAFLGPLGKQFLSLYIFICKIYLFVKFANCPPYHKVILGGLKH